MSLTISKSGRRWAVLINYGCLLIFVGMFIIGKYLGWNIAVIVCGLLALIILLLSFAVLHVKTRLWKLVHSNTADLDERELQLTLQSLRQSYIIYATVSLLVIFSLAMLAGRHDSTLIIIYAGLLYLAHTLPSTIIAWRERQV
jgi:hypothetical protein